MQTNYRYKDDRKNKHVHGIIKTVGQAEAFDPLMGTTKLIKEVMPPNLAKWSARIALEPFGYYPEKMDPLDIPEVLHELFREMNERLVKADPWNVTIPLSVRLVALTRKIKEILTMPIPQLLKFFDDAFNQHNTRRDQAGEYGTDAHNAIEIAVKEAIAQNGGYLDSSPYEHEAVERFAGWGRGKMFIHSEAHVFSEKLWVGGIVDLVYMENDKFYLGDVKTSKTIYPSHLIQMGLYDNLQEENGFVNADGLRVGERKDIAGYTVINVPRNQSGIVVKTCPAERIKKEVPALVGFYKLLKDLEIIIK